MGPVYLFIRSTQLFCKFSVRAESSFTVQGRRNSSYARVSMGVNSPRFNRAVFGTFIIQRQNALVSKEHNAIAAVDISELFISALRG